ncbi:flagellar assembly protein FliX [Hwanghaeella sp.]|uniref:flagellar assembly protein FliX n=1 Tax=Hwanghaeella sp. TaxID=2605943 RepID=UPI003CCB860C
MKVEGPNKSSATTGAKKAGAAKRSGGASFASSLNSSDSSDSVEKAAPSAGGLVGAVDALIALQEVDAPEQTEGEGPLSGDREQRARKWGQDMLDGLEEIRIGLLLGRIPTHRLDEIAKAASQGKTQSNDPRLAAVLGEIEVRAMVELAKLQR